MMKIQRKAKILTGLRMEKGDKVIYRDGIYIIKKIHSSFPTNKVLEMSGLTISKNGDRVYVYPFEVKKVLDVIK